jgi:glutaredoxin
MRTLELAVAFALVAALTHAGPVAAQYKWVGPGGAVNYSDLPPPPGVEATRVGAAPVAKVDDGGLPAGLRAIAGKYPVTLYTTNDCSPCSQGRSMLTKRGIPFTERTVANATDAAAFKQAGFAENSFPSLSVGGQRSVGFEGGEWERLLDAAGYPKTSALPTSYKYPPAKALAVTAPAEGSPAPVASDANAEAAAPQRVRQASRAEGQPSPTRNATTLRF